MSFADWIDTGVTPPQRLPGDADAVAAYLADALGHVVYMHWTLAVIKRCFPSLADAKSAKPALMRLLLNETTAIEFWDRGRARVASVTEAPERDAVLMRVLRAHSRRFKRDTDGVHVATTGERKQEPGLVAALPPAFRPWLARAGRYANPENLTNTLGVGDDVQAVALFLRDRGSRSPHTTRAYLTEIRRLVAWCVSRELGPLSDLTRLDLLEYRRTLRHPSRRAVDDTEAPRKLSEAAEARALAVVASLFRYWTETGYLRANPAAGLVHGQRRHAGVAPARMLTVAQLAACDVQAADVMADVEPIVAARRRAIWTLYRYAGVRLVELVWNDDLKLPTVEVDTDGCWTLLVSGKGRKFRSIPLPPMCVSVLQAYRQLRGLLPQPESGERVALIHGLKGGSLQSSGLYDEVKAIFEMAAATLEPTDPTSAATLRRASPHWLRHAYARTLVVDRQVPLTAAQALLGHASIQTTAGYAKTDLSQLRAFVDRAFSAD